MDSKELLERIKRTKQISEEVLKESQRILEQKPKEVEVKTINLEEDKVTEITTEEPKTVVTKTTKKKKSTK